MAKKATPVEFSEDITVKVCDLISEGAARTFMLRSAAGVERKEV
jgi:hypothetical protein